VSRGFIRDFKVFFFRGLAVTLPLLLTVWIIIKVFQFIQNELGKYLDNAAQWVVIQYWSFSEAMGWSIRGTEAETEAPTAWWTFWGSPAEWADVKSMWSAHDLQYVGIILVFVLIYVVGRFMASFVGRSSLRTVEAGLRRVPVIRELYPQVKKVTDVFFADKKVEFSRVVAVQYPRKDIWSLGLVTARGMRKIRDTVGEDMLAIFIPSSPVPLTGYTIMVRKEDVIDLPLSIDEAFRFTISGGVVQPPSELLPQTGVRQSHLEDADQALREEANS
jgi:uncharacterized membrane protein